MELEDVLGLLSTLDKREIPDEEFAENAALSQGLMPALDDMQKLILYGLYKQTVSGNAPKQIENIDKASPEYYKWQAWRSFFDLSRNDAKRLYVYFVNQYQQVAEISAAGKKSGRDIEGVGSSVSTLYVDYSTQTNELMSQSPILQAVHSCDTEGLRKLLTESTETIDAKYNSDMTALHFAADKGFDAITKILMEHGANVNAQDDSGHTPLMYAIICSYQGVIDALLSSSTIDLSLTNGDGESVWDLAASDEDLLAQLKDNERRR